MSLIRPETLQITCSDPSWRQPNSVAPASILKYSPALSAFTPHEQSLMVARLATVRTTAALEGPLRVGPINFWKSPLRGLYAFVLIIL